jgi:hypothetical protein
MNCINIAATEAATSVVADIYGETGKSEKAFATNAVIETILSRSAAKYYDPTATLSDDQIRDLVRIGTSAPTSFHLAELALHRCTLACSEGAAASDRLESARDHRRRRYLHHHRPACRCQHRPRPPGTGGGSRHHAGAPGAGMGNPRSWTV